MTGEKTTTGWSFLWKTADYQEKASASLMKGAKDVGAVTSGPETRWKYILVIAAITAVLIGASAVAFLRWRNKHQSRQTQMPE
jgi:hypothetical protein